MAFSEKRPLTVKFSKFCSESFHHDTDGRVSCSIFVKFGRREIGEIMRCLPNKKISPVATARIAPKMCQGQPPTMYSACSRFHQNRFTSGGVTAERVNTAKTRQSNVIVVVGRSGLNSFQESLDGPLKVDLAPSGGCWSV